jgi:hypothetical protein
LQECCQAWKVDGPEIASAAKAPAAAQPALPSPNKPLPLRAKSPRAVPAIPTIFSHKVVNLMQFSYELLHLYIYM